MKKALIGLGVLLILLAGYGGYIFYVAGQFNTIKPHIAGNCTKVPGVVGAEDITIHPVTGVAFIAAENRRAASNGAAEQGAIWAYNLKSRKPQLIKLTDAFTQEFHAHGLSLWPQNRGGMLMAVNHRGGGGVMGSNNDAIEIFELKAGRLVHKKTVEDPLLKSVNDVVAAGPDSFYATVDHAFSEGIMRKVEDYARLPLSFVVYYDGHSLRKVAQGFRYANGVNLSLDKTILYVAGTTDGAITAFQRNQTDGALSGRREVKLGTGVDNIEIGAGGSLWVAGHPHLFDFLAHAKDPSKKSPSQVLKLTPNTYRFDVQEIFLDNGDLLSGSSVGAPYENRLLVGSVFEPYFLDCTLK